MRALVPVALMLVACGGLGYGDARRRLVTHMDPAMPAMPTLAELGDHCPAGAHLVDHVQQSRDGAGMQRFCADADGAPVGMSVIGYVHEPPGGSTELHAYWGAWRDHRRDGPWTVVLETDWWTGGYRAGTHVGPFHGVRLGQPFAGAFDDEGRLDGVWTLPDGTFTFDHGTGHVAFTLEGGERVEGECVEGLRDGLWRSTGSNAVREVEHVRGAMQGHVRTVDTSGRVFEEGLVDSGAWVRWRGPVMGRCLATSVESGMLEAKGAKIVVAESCMREVASFEVDVTCERRDECTYARVTEAGLVPLTEDERSIVELPIVRTDEACPTPFDSWIWVGSGEPLATR